MGQSRWASLREAAENTAIGFLLSLLSHKYIVAPLTEVYVLAGGEITDWSVAALTTLYYTLLSLGRNYVVRRRGNKREGKKAGEKNDSGG